MGNLFSSPPVYENPRDYYWRVVIHNLATSVERTEEVHFRGILPSEGRIWSDVHLAFHPVYDNQYDSHLPTPETRVWGRTGHDTEGRPLFWIYWSNTRIRPDQPITLEYELTFESLHLRFSLIHRQKQLTN